MHPHLSKSRKDWSRLKCSSWFAQLVVLIRARTASQLEKV